MVLTVSEARSLCGQLGKWNRDDKLGVAFSSSAGFTLPNGAVRSPTVSWVKREKWDALTEHEQEVFAPICPDFLVEFCTEYDSLCQLQSKMREYLDNGCLLGWLIDVKTWQVEIYRQNKDVEVLQSPATLLSEFVLPEFVLNLETIQSVG